MPLGLTLHGKWDGISMASPQLQYKHERPAYSTPQPVENTPANNECRMVELRGAKVASFFVGGDEFICLPQAFDLFLKHLVGGLHTVYTKLKRLSISPVVCNVEQVRILRGLGAIQPGVNRCKLITRKDFEILYQDCTQASRPGRPPKRYPMLPPSTDLMTHHAGMRSLNAGHTMLSPTDISNFHKRIRLEHEAEKQLMQQERRMSQSPTKEISSQDKDLVIAPSSELHTGAANIYLQAQQALRQQYQQAAASGLQNGIDAQHVAAAAGINPALAPLMMMSHPGLFSGALPPSSMNMLNHINQFAQSHGNIHQAAQAAAQVAAAAQSAAHASLAAAASARSNSRDESGQVSQQDDKDSDCEEVHTPRSHSSITNENSGLQNGISGDVSPHSSAASSAFGADRLSDGSLSVHSDSADSQKENSGPTLITGSTFENENRDRNFDQERDGSDDVTKDMPNSIYVNTDTDLTGPANISSMQTLLTNIQGLLKVAADNAKLQEKQSSFEIADLKNRVTKEKQIRSSMEKRLHESERIREIMQKRLRKERKIRKVLQDQLQSMKRKIGKESDSVLEKIVKSPTTDQEICDAPSPTSSIAVAFVTQTPYSQNGSPPLSSTGMSPHSTVLNTSSTSSTKSVASSGSQQSPATVSGGTAFSYCNSNNSCNNDPLSPPQIPQASGIASNSSNAAQSAMRDNTWSMDFSANKRTNPDQLAHAPDARVYFNTTHYQGNIAQ